MAEEKSASAAALYKIPEFAAFGSVFRSSKCAPCSLVVYCSGGICFLL